MYWMSRERLRRPDLLSPFNSVAWEADGLAFAALIRHLKESNKHERTVLMVQVENESGLLGDSRDRSRVADEAFSKPVPEDLLEYLMWQDSLHPLFEKRWPGFQDVATRNTSWESVFGQGAPAEEMFMADAFARYVHHVASAGKQEYDIPFYTNAWLGFDYPSVLDLEGIEGKQIIAGGGAKAGIYPSGGPVPCTLDIWNFHTIEKGSLDFISPDLYLHDYKWVCEQYRYKNNPLFIPEQKADKFGVRRTWLAYGSFQALGCSPFGIDTVHLNEDEINSGDIATDCCTACAGKSYMPKQIIQST